MSKILAIDDKTDNLITISALLKVISMWENRCLNIWDIA